MSNERIIRKIKHCLALSQSSNPDEAATALRQAQKLMHKHNINEFDTLSVDINEHRVNSTTKTTPPTWQFSLAEVVADAMGCAYHCNTWRRGSGHQSAFVFYGFDYQPEIAAYALEVLLRQVTKERKEFVARLDNNFSRYEKRRNGDYFCSGWVKGVAEVVQSFALPEQQEQAIDKYQKDNYSLKPWTRKAKRAVRGARTSEEQGFDRGQKANLSRGTGHQDTVRLESGYDR